MKTEKEKLILAVFCVMLLGSNKDKKRLKKIVKRDKKIIAIIMSTAYHHPRIHIVWTGDKMKDAPAVALKAQSIHDKAALSSYLTGITGLTLVLSTLQTDIDDFIVLISNAEGGSDQDKEKLKIAIPEFMKVKIKPLLDIVQTVSFANKGKESDVAKSADMELVPTAKHGEQQWELKRVAQGSVETVGHVKGLKGKYTIVWQRTTTPNDENSWWTKANFIYPTPYGRNIVTGLVLKTEVFWRYCIVTKDGISDWSDVLSIIIS